MTDITISPSGLRIVKLLVGKPPQSIASLAEEIGVTRTAISEHIKELLASGLVEQKVEKLSGRGRPRYVYRTTNVAMRFLFANPHCLVVPSIWRAIREEGGDGLNAKVLARVTSALIHHYSGFVTAKRPRERLRQMLEVLANEGALIEAVQEAGGKTVLYRRSCPYSSMADERRNVCRIDQALLSKLVGRSVRKTACRHEGAPCCAFLISDEKA